MGMLERTLRVIKARFSIFFLIWRLRLVRECVEQIRQASSCMEGVFRRLVKRHITIGEALKEFSSLHKRIELALRFLRKAGF